jgi:hypothetical protein
LVGINRTNGTLDFDFGGLNNRKKYNKRRGKRITVTIDKKLLDFLDYLISKRIFANRSHAFEFLIRKKAEFENERENYYYLR